LAGQLKNAVTVDRWRRPKGKIDEPHLKRSIKMVQAVRSRIEETNAQFMAALNKGDTAKVAELYTVDAIVLPPNAETVRGREAAKQLFDGMVQQMGIPTLTLTTVEVTELGDTAHEVGTYTMRLQPAGGDAVNDSGKYVVIWKRQGDGAWKLAVDIWNTDLPMPTA
jgi:uncharacterized protein (TIGR02246 family)